MTDLEKEVRRIERERELAERLHGHWVAQRTPFEQFVLRAKRWHVVVLILALIGLGAAVAGAQKHDQPAAALPASCQQR